MFSLTEPAIFTFRKRRILQQIQIIQSISPLKPYISITPKRMFLTELQMAAGTSITKPSIFLCPSRGLTKKLPGRTGSFTLRPARRIRLSFYSMALESTSSRSFSINASTVILPRSPAFLPRTETSPLSASLSPTTSI